MALKGFYGIYGSSHLIVELRPTGAPHHLQDIGDGIIHVALGLAIEKLRALHHDQMGGEVDAPSQGRGGDEHLDLLIHEQFFNHLSVALLKAAQDKSTAIKKERKKSGSVFSDKGNKIRILFLKKATMHYLPTHKTQTQIVA